MSENYTSFENQNERGYSFIFDSFNPEDEAYSMFDDYLL